MARMIVDTDMEELPMVGPGVLLIHEEMPPYIVMSTGIVMGDLFPGVALGDGSYGEEWEIAQYRVFKGAIKLEQ